jgi:hypothetical protein
MMTVDGGYGDGSRGGSDFGSGDDGYLGGCCRVEGRKVYDRNSELR